jgi:hypothetical protein
MGTIREILAGKEKPKERIARVVGKVSSDGSLMKELMELLKSGTDSEKGNCADALKHISADRPELVAPYADTLIGYVNHKLPRVKWGVPEAIGNISKTHPKEAEKAIPGLLKNTKDESTVVKWCAAYALTELAKNNPGTRKQLVPMFEEQIKKEKNNGVRKVYEKAMKVIEKEK